VTHLDNVKPKEEMKDYYEEDYRPPPTSANHFTGQRKLHYHQAFLKPLFKKWKEQDKTSPKVFESGAAFGMFLKFVKEVCPDADVSGTEWTKSFRRIAYHQFKIPLYLEPPEGKKYDLIASYKVAEHQVDADKELRKLVEMLEPGGHFYISVPTWFGSMYNFGMSGFDLDYYYHKDHINVWSEKLFRTLLKKVGLEIVDYNGVIYDSTFLCVRNDELMKEAPEYENPDEILKKMADIKASFEHFKKGETKEAIEAYANYPTAWMAHYEKNRNTLDKLGIQELYKQQIALGLEACPSSADLMIHAGQVLARYEEYEMALQHFDKALEMRPNAAGVLIERGQTLFVLAHQVGKEEDKVKLLQEARGTFYYAAAQSDQSKFNCLDWIYKIESMLPIPEEIECS
jgi:SAM-dependent methyltransferase